MKKFSQVDYKIDNKKYKEKSKNDIYSLIKENININIIPLNENKKSDLDNININLEGTDKLVNNINKYIEKKILEERVKVLESVKSSIATGTLNIQKINEEIISCECSETCPVSEIEDEEIEDVYIDDFDESINKDTEFVDTYENKNINLADEFIKLVDEGKAENMSWEQFFDIYNIPKKSRTNSVVDTIMKQVSEKRKNIFN